MADRDPITELFAALEFTWNEADAAAYARLFAAEATFVTRSGILWRGRPAIEEGHANAFAGTLANTMLTLRPMHIALPATTVAVAHVDVELSGDATMVRAVTTFVLTLTGDRWSVLAAHTGEIASVH